MRCALCALVLLRARRPRRVRFHQKPIRQDIPSSCVLAPSWWLLGAIVSFCFLHSRMRNGRAYEGYYCCAMRWFVVRFAGLSECACICVPRTHTCSLCTQLLSFTLCRHRYAYNIIIFMTYHSRVCSKAPARKENCERKTKD